MVADYWSIARGWSADFIPIMMLTHRMPGIIAHWSDAMSEFRLSYLYCLDLTVLLERDIKVMRPSHIFIGPKEQTKGVSSRL